MFEVAKENFQKIFKNEISQDEARKYLIELYKRGETAEEIAAATEVMREHSIKLIISEALREKLIDIVGTGGDKSNSFNISSTVSLLLPTFGCSVAKHGNRAITSKSGSADMLEALGINLNLDTTKQVKMLGESGFTFLFAINHHPAMKYIMPLRKSIEHRSIFNILGPLTNPAGARKYLIGVFSDEFLNRIIVGLSMLDTKSAVAVSSRDKMDEISISDITYATILKDNRTRDFIIDPQEFGIKLAPKEAIIGGSAKDNAKITYSILKGEEKGAKRDIVLLNTAMALVVDDKARDIQEGLEMARDSIESKKAFKKLEEIIKVSNTI
ncbi:MAG: anthranilate phosphoribosyltransferase [Sulfurospirillaceae bacterium]|nr:anthranilate phosphoribosyltransferase [Sulfurospirillaceae bacterium]